MPRQAHVSKSCFGLFITGRSPVLSMGWSSSCILWCSAHKSCRYQHEPGRLNALLYVCFLYAFRNFGCLHFTFGQVCSTASEAQPLVLTTSYY